MIVETDEFVGNFENYMIVARIIIRYKYTHL